MFSKIDTIVKDGIIYLVLPMGALCNEGQLKSVVWFDFCDSGQFLSDLTLGDESVIGNTRERKGNVHERLSHIV